MKIRQSRFLFMTRYSEKNLPNYSYFPNFLDLVKNICGLNSF